MITNTWKVFYTTTTYEYYGVFLKVVTFSADVGPYFVTVRKTNTCNFTKCRVRLLWCLSCNFDTNTTLKWSGFLVVTGL